MGTHRSPLAVTVAMNRDLQERFRLALALGLGAALATWLLNGFLRFDAEATIGAGAAGGIALRPRRDGGIHGVLPRPARVARARHRLCGGRPIRTGPARCLR
jgi:hypothetical protein